MTEPSWLGWLGKAVGTVVDAAKDQDSGGSFWSRLGTRLMKELKEVVRSKDPVLSSARASKLEYSTELGDWKLVVSIVEDEIGLESSDFFTPERLEEKVQTWWNGLAPTPATRIFLAYLRSLAKAERQPDQVALLEALFGLRWNDYHKPEQLDAKLWEGIDRIAPEVPAARISSILLLAGALSVTGRETESVAVLETLTELGDTTPSAFAERLVSAYGGSIGSAAGFLEVVGTRSGNLRRRALEAIEALAGIVPADYRDRRQLRKRLQSLDKTLGERLFFGVDRVEVFRALCLLLLRDERPADALTVVSAELLSPDESIPRFISHLDRRLRLFPPDVAARFFQVIVIVLREALPPEPVAVILESVLGADEKVDWNEPWSLGFAVQDHWRRDETAAFYVQQTAEALVAAGRPERAALLVNAYVTSTSPFSEKEIPVIFAKSCPIYDLWLSFLPRDDEGVTQFHFRKPLEVCRSLVPYLRKMLAEGGTTLEDREELIRSVARLRRRIVQAGLFWAEREIDPERARYEVLLWDLELAQQLLIERFLLTGIRRVAATEPPPAGRWPWREGKGEREPATRDHLPPLDEPEALAGVLGEIAAPATSLTIPEQMAPGAGRVRPYERLALFARQGVDEAALAAGLGPGGVLLRATFDPDGRLAWNALASEGARLGVAAHGFGAPGDLDRLRWAAARHDFRIGYAHWYQAVKPFHGVLETGCQELLKAVRTRTTYAMEEAPEPVHESIDHLLRLLTWPDPHRTSAAAADTLRFAEDLISNTTEAALRRELDRATTVFLEEVSAVWNLAPLSTILDSDTDLVIQVDDALHAVPVAWLPVGREPLFRRARSVRTSLAPVLDLLMGNLEREIRESGPRSRRMLSVSSFERGDLARPGGRWLHHGQIRLAEIHQYECLAGADREGGTVGAIRGALDRYGRFETAAVCGHGDFERMGIVLSAPDGSRALWQGDGCDLGGIEWLLLVSCSIGRAAQTGDPDVEGFCVQLSSHRARSVAACRWPVLSVQAAAFANEAVHQYLKLIAEEPHNGPLRARALNLARRRFSEEDGDQPLVGINTAAAFELYGLG